MQRLEAALKEATAFLKRKGVRYADARFVETLGEDIQVKDQAVEALVRETDRGVGVRVLWRGAWGFASTADLSDGAVHEAAEAALRTARASALANTEKSKLAPQEPHEGEWRGPCERDPFLTPLDEKLEELFRATEILKKNPAIKTAEGSMNFARRTRLFVSTDGACLRQVKTTSGAGVSATAILNGEFQRRSYPTSQGGNHASRGYEFVEAMHLPSHAERVAEEAAALLRAPECPYGKRDLIVGSSQLSLQVHESCGHPIELDRVLGSEVSLAGGSFLTLDKWKKLRYGSPGVSITADATIEGGLGSFGFDDEGVPARRTPVVKEGLFVNYLTSRETARALGLRSNGSMRADGWNVMPLIRMVNVSLEPGGADLESLVADTRDGVLVDTNKSWSIDDLRLNFQFGCEIGWRIEHGRVTGIVKNPLYTGATPEFWNACDAVCGPKEWKLWGVANCGKGEPMQTAKVGHGTAPARFRQIEVGVNKK
jgi:TldD protein